MIDESARILSLKRSLRSIMDYLAKESRSTSWIRIKSVPLSLGHQTLQALNTEVGLFLGCCGDKALY